MKTQARGVVIALGQDLGQHVAARGVLKARVIVVPPWDSPARSGVLGMIISSALLLSGVSPRPGCLWDTLLLSSALSAAISAAEAPVNDHADALPRGFLGFAHLGFFTLSGRRIGNRSGKL